MKRTAHIALFVLAFLVFYVGLVTGLQYNVMVGTALWASALAVVAINIGWMIWPNK